MIVCLAGVCSDAVQDMFGRMMTGMPPEAWWLAALVLLVLGAAAAVDSFTATIPDPLIFAGLLAVTAAQGAYTSWPEAAHRLAIAIAIGVAIWVFNEIWYRVSKHDAIGMGDAKWTILAIAAFDIAPVVMSWGVGALLGVMFMAGMKIAKRPLKHLHFAPFLFAGLLAGLWWLRLQ